MIAEANIHREHGRPARPRHVAHGHVQAQGTPHQPSQVAETIKHPYAIQLLGKSMLAFLVRP